MSELHDGDDLPSRFEPTREQIDDLIRRATEHELGLEFLRTGSQDAVAAIFGVHAFTVDAARRVITDGGDPGP